MKSIFVLSMGVVLCTAELAAAGQSLPPLPSGFQADQQAAQIMAQMRASGVGDGFRGQKPTTA